MEKVLKDLETTICVRVAQQSFGIESAKHAVKELVLLANFNDPSHTTK